jgi:hypothetical protein
VVKNPDTNRNLLLAGFKILSEAVTDPLPLMIILGCRLSFACPVIEPNRFQSDKQTSQKRCPDFGAGRTQDFPRM